MALRCSMFGCEYDGTEIEREREQRGSEVVLTVREYEECRRCGEIRLISENTGVTTAPTGEDGGGSGADAPGGADPATGATPDVDSTDLDHPTGGDDPAGPGAPDPPIEEAEPGRPSVAGVADAIQDAEGRAIDGAVPADRTGDDPGAGDERGDDGSPPDDGAGPDDGAAPDDSGAPDDDPTPDDGTTPDEDHAPDDDAVILAGSDADGADDGSAADPVEPGGASAAPATDDPTTDDPSPGDPANGDPANGDPHAQETATANPARAGENDAATGGEDRGDDRELPDDDAVILAEESERPHGEWPTPGTGGGETNADPQWDSWSDGTVDGGDAAQFRTDDGSSVHGAGATAGDDADAAADRAAQDRDREHGEWPTAGDDPADDAADGTPDPSDGATGAPEGGDWPTPAAEDEGWAATPTDDGDVPVEMTGLTPRGGDEDGDASGPTVAAEHTASPATGSVPARQPAGADLCCGECGHAIAATRTPLQPGDICPACASGYLAESETRNR